MKYWTIHTSVLKGIICLIPGSGDPACITFIDRISNSSDDAIALDREGTLLRDYLSLADLPPFISSSLITGFIRNLLTDDKKSKSFSSKMPVKKYAILEKLNIEMNDRRYFVVAINADKILVHSRKFNNATKNVCLSKIGLTLHDTYTECEY